jgi:hypothetical protein
MSELSEYAMRLLMNVHCPNCGHEQLDSGDEQLCEACHTTNMVERTQDAREVFLVESIESDLVKNIAETTKLDYLLKFEKYLDDRDLYLYQGWEDAQILGPPKVDKYWVIVDLRVSENCELKGALRCCNAEDDDQNTVRYKRLEDGSYYVRFKILRRLLDKVEMDAKDRAEEIADEESEV